MFKTILLSSVFCLFALKSFSQQSGEVFRFLELNQHAKAAALGGNHPAIESADFSLFTINPAYLSLEQNQNLQASYINHLDDISFGSASYQHNFEGIGSFGISLHVLGYGDLTRFDEFGNDLGNFSANDLSLSIGYAMEITENVHIGALVTGIYSSLDTFNSSAISGSAGIYYLSGNKRTQLGASLRHAGFQLSTFNGRREPLPFDISIGAAHKLETLPFRFYITTRNLHDWNLVTANDSGSPGTADQIFRHFVFGNEILFSSNFIFRLGYDHLLHEQAKTGKRIDGAGLSMGFGVKVKTTEVDIARTSFSDLGNLIQLSLKLSI